MYNSHMSATIFSAVLITRQRPQLLEDCLRALVAALTGLPGEIVVAINGQDTESFILASEIAEEGKIKVLQLKGLCRGEARNAAIAACSGSWLCFFDDDTVAASGHFQNLLQLIKAFPEASVFGGGQRIDRAGAGTIEKTVYRVTGSLLGAGPFITRFAPVYGDRRAGAESFVLCNLCLRRSFLERHELAFEGHFSSAEENLLLNKMEAAGALMVLSGRLNIVHRRRSSFPKFFRQVFTSGAGRAQITLYHKAGFTAFTLIPPLVLAAFAAALLFAPRAAAAALVYLFFVVVFAARAALLEKRPAVFLAALPAYAGLHLFYAFGWFYGLWGVAADRLRGRVRPSRCVCR